jgi:hypothetical protein
MRNRDDMSAVIEILQRDHGLLAAYLEATNKIDWQALRKPCGDGQCRGASSVVIAVRLSACQPGPSALKTHVAEALEIIEDPIN